MKTTLLSIPWILGVHFYTARGFSECRSSRIDNVKDYYGKASLTCQKSSVTVKTIFTGSSLEVDDFEVVCSGKEAIKLLRSGDKIRSKQYQRKIPVNRPENCVLFGCYYDRDGDYYQLPPRSCSYKESYSDYYQYDDSYDSNMNLEDDYHGNLRQHDESGSKPPGSCSDIPRPQVGEVDQGVRIAIYTCPAGYSLQGIRTRTCSEGSWIPEKPPVCLKNNAATGIISSIVYLLPHYSHFLSEVIGI